VPAMKDDQLVENRVPPLAAQVVEYHLARHHVVGNSAEPARHAHPHGSRIPPGRTLHLSQSLEVCVATDQVVGDQHDGVTKRAVGAADQRTVRIVDLIALISRGIKSCSTGNRPRCCVVRYRPRLARELPRRDHIDPGNAHEQDIGCRCQQSGDLLLQPGTLASFGLPVIVEFGPDPLVDVGVIETLRGASGPGAEVVKTVLLEGDFTLLEDLRQARDTSLAEDAGRSRVSGDQEGDVALEQAIEATRIAWHNDIQMLFALTPQHGTLADQITAVTDQELKLGVGEFEGSLDQAEAVDRRAVLSEQIGVIGLVPVIRRLPEVFGGATVDGASFETRLLEHPLGTDVIVARALDRHSRIKDLVFTDGLLQHPQQRVEARARVFEDRFGHEHLAVEICQHPIRPVLGRIDANNPKVLGTDLLNSGMDDPLGLVDLSRPPRTTATTRILRFRHDAPPFERGTRIPIPQDGLDREKREKNSRNPIPVTNEAPPQTDEL
jgi:hypothetical protein